MCIRDRAPAGRSRRARPAATRRRSCAAWRPGSSGSRAPRCAPLRARSGSGQPRARCAGRPRPARTSPRTRARGRTAPSTPWPRGRRCACACAVRGPPSARPARCRPAPARHMRKHIDDLAAKEYWEQFSPAPEFVVMFVPAEAFLHTALEVDPTLIEHAMEHNVVLATPMTLVAMLRTIAYAWRQDALAANAQQVLTLGRELHGRLSTLGGHVGRLGRQLDGAVRSYNETVSSLESRVLVSARRLAELKVTDAELEPPAESPDVTTEGGQP